MLVSNKSSRNSATNSFCRHITQCRYMFCNMKICRLRRRAVGSFFLLLVLCCVVVVYAALLRSSKSSGSVFRLQKKNRVHKKVNKHNASMLVGHAKGKKITISHELPIFIVENHQEVLSLWIEAGNSGTIRKYGNTLVHIDSKADFNIPSLFPGHSHFKWPPQNQIHSMNHSRNTAIMSALISGLYNRFVWVWPKWNTKNHIKAHSIVYASFGRTVNAKKPPGKTPTTCFCISYFKKGVKNCSVQHGNKSPYAEKSIPFTQCNIKRLAKIEKIREDLALEFLRNGKLIRKDENVVLDIDEEYIGYELPVASLFAAGLTIANVTSINRDVQRIICPKVMKDEIKADNLLSKVIYEISKLRQYYCTKENPKNCSKFPVNHNFLSLQHVFIESLSSLSPGLSCKKKVTSKYLEKFVLKLASLKEKQMLALREVGFCFTPVSKTLNLEYHFQLCIGGSVLNNSMRHPHSLQQQEVITRIKFFQKFMSQAKFRPRLITLARSLRSGFTPRKYFHKIEREILASFRNFHSKLQFHYGVNLLGSKFGWPRHHAQNITVRH